MNKLILLILSAVIFLNPLSVDLSQAERLRRPRALPLPIRIATKVGGEMVEYRLKKAIIQKSVNYAMRKLQNRFARMDADTLEVITQSGLRFVTDPRTPQGHRLLHVLDHFVPSPGKATHSIYRIDPSKFLKIADDAWMKRGKPVVQKMRDNSTRDMYEIDTGQKLGTLGERTLVFITEPGTSKIITMFPKL